MRGVQWQRCHPGAARCVRRGPWDGVGSALPDTSQVRLFLSSLIWSATRAVRSCLRIPFVQRLLLRMGQSTISDNGPSKHSANDEGHR
jgi:hypothetical protein